MSTGAWNNKHQQIVHKTHLFRKAQAAGEKRTLTVGKSLEHSVKKLWVAVRSIATMTQSFHNAGLLWCWGKAAEKPLPSNPNHLTNVMGVLPMQTSVPFEPDIHETLNAHAFQTHFSKSEYLLVFVLVWSPSSLLRPRPWGQCVPGIKSTSKLGRLTKCSHWGGNDKRDTKRIPIFVAWIPASLPAGQGTSTSGSTWSRAKPLLGTEM